MANYSRWDDVKKKRRVPTTESRAGVEQDLPLGQLIYDLRTEAGISQRELAERMGTTQSVISRLEEGGVARNRIDTLARVANARGRHLVVSFCGCRESHRSSSGDRPIGPGARVGPRLGDEVPAPAQLVRGLDEDALEPTVGEQSCDSRQHRPVRRLQHRPVNTPRAGPRPKHERGEVARSAPQSADGHGADAIVEIERSWSGVQDDTGGEAVL
ncbi:MAG: helix-turn-helix domain-containing protein [Actinomycetota bacterium]|nr:helix-turn-helix domain-containing protein [Actinomycetota bacterium]